MCICCEIFPACIDRYWEFPEHPCVVNACCYACCGNGLEDPNLAQRIFCQCNTVANYDECGSEPHLISLALCPFLIPGAVYAAFFWEQEFGHDSYRSFLIHALLRFDVADFIGQRVGMNGTIIHGHVALLTDISQRMLHPICIITIWKIFTGVGTAAFCPICR